MRESISVTNLSAAFRIHQHPIFMLSSHTSKCSLSALLLYNLTHLLLPSLPIPFMKKRASFANFAGYECENLIYQCLFYFPSFRSCSEGRKRAPFYVEKTPFPSDPISLFLPPLENKVQHTSTSLPELPYSLSNQHGIF